MLKLEFEVQGTASKPYTVTVVNHHNKVVAVCTCAAAEKGTFCQHRIKLLQGNVEGVVSENANEIETAMKWIQGTELESVMFAITEKEKEMEMAKEEIGTLKQKLSRLLVAA